MMKTTSVRGISRKAMMVCGKIGRAKRCFVTRPTGARKPGCGRRSVTALQKDWSDLCTIVGECGGIDRLRELAEADKDGRLAVLPCKPDGSMLNTSDPERPEIMKRIHFAVAYVCGGIVFHQPYNIFIENVAAGYIRPLNEEAEKALEAKKDE